jgi:hypothetical protein
MEERVLRAESDGNKILDGKPQQRKQLRKPVPKWKKNIRAYLWETQSWIETS